MSDEFDVSTLITLSRLEAQTLQSFIGQVDYWLSIHGDKASKVQIVYYPEDDALEVSNNEPKNGLLSRGRATRFRTDILAWGNQVLNQLSGWDHSKQVTTFGVSYQDGQYGISVAVSDEPAEQEDSAPEDEGEQDV